MITEGMEIYQKSIGIFQKGIGEDLTKPLKIVLTYVVIVYVMELIAYGKYNAVTMTRNMIIIYIITFILSGAVNAYYWENRVDDINVTKTILFVFLYAMALQSTFENTIKNTLKNAFLMGIGHFPWTLLIVFITLLPIILLVLLGRSAGSVVYVMLFVGFAVLAYLNSYIFNHIFKRYM